MAFGKKVKSAGCKGFVWRIWRNRSWGPWIGDSGQEMKAEDSPYIKSQTLNMGWRGAGLYWSPLSGGPAVLGKCGGCGGTESCGDISSSKLKADKKTLDVIQRTALQVHHSPPCRDPPWDDGTFVMASLAPPKAVSKDDTWGKCNSSWAAFQPWESPALWWSFSIEYMFFCKYLFCSFPLQVELLNSTHY